MTKLKSIFSFIVIGLMPFTVKAQELFISQEPASNMPQHTLGVRLMGEEYKEGKQIRTQETLRLMYGFTPRFTLILSGTVANHHLDTLPPELTSTDNGALQLHSHNKQLGFPRPYLFSGVNLYGKYLLVKDDGEQSHFRVALIGEAAYNKQAHDEAEPNLMGDNAGIAAGLVVTRLYHKFAYSMTGEYIIPFKYKEKDVEVKYPNAVEYALSFGYRVLPGRYKNYKQLNINVYAEFTGKTYGNATITKNGVKSSLQGATFLQSNSYLEFHPGIQFLINSNTRIDLSMGFNIIGRSYSYTYPTHFIQLQHYFFLK